MDGILNINKPPGRTSFSVVAMVRKLCRERRVGHAGTLDAMAGGVLPVCVGKGTRVIEFLMDARKLYRAVIRLGVATDTYDATGKVIQEGNAAGISREQVELALETFCGSIVQTPPMYSALKYRGQRLYRLARAGMEIKRESRPTTVYRIELKDFVTTVVTLEVECSRGTYIRSLAHDLGQMLGCGAHLEHLLRLKYGPFDIDDAVSLKQFEEGFNNGSWQKLVYPIDTVLGQWTSVVVGEEQERMIKHGGSVVIEDIQIEDGVGSRCRAYNRDGYFIAILYFDPEKRQWQPEKVFA
ncbi:MAG TPA: tRNA pseudouridine(55) synthase TruB [Dehalococcoidia bacterium]|nr:tRNA pseudouridine(55) synthase TruB [Dehalococcoidia bacterium]